jgi:hypothetical protein
MDDGALLSVIVCATHVITAFGAHQLAVVSGKAMAARRANLGVMLGSGQIGVFRLTLWDGFAVIGRILAGKPRIEGPGAMGKHG